MKTIVSSKAGEGGGFGRDFEAGGADEGFTGASEGVKGSDF